MKKRLLVGIVVITTLTALAILLAIVNANTIISTYKPSLEAGLSRALGANVSLGELSFTLFPYPSVFASKCEVRGRNGAHYNGAQYNGAQSGITVGALHARAALKPLFSRRLELSALTITKPIITLQQTDQGIAVKGTLDSDIADSDIADSDIADSDIADKATPPKATATESSTTTSTQLRTTSSSTTQSSTTQASTTAPYAATTAGISIKRLVIEDGTITIENPSGVALHSITNINLDMGVAVSGDTLEVPTITATLQALAKVPVSFRASDVAYNTTSNTTSIPRGEISVPAGTIKLSSVTIAPKTSSVSVVADTLNLSKLLEMTGSFAGTVDGTITRARAEITGVSLENPHNTAQGTGAITINNGVIRGLNIPSQALQRISSLPLIGGDIRTRIPPEFQHLFIKADTTVHELSTDLSIAKGTLHLKNLLLASDYFSLRGNGTYALRGEADLAVDLMLDPKVSAGITTRVKELAPLLDSQGSLVVPVIVSGTLPSLLVTPNLDAILTKARTAGVTQALDRMLKDKKIGGKLGKILGF
jgi:uncharacterized protein involved in outer membrane biogenesis